LHFTTHLKTRSALRIICFLLFGGFISVCAQIPIPYSCRQEKKILEDIKNKQPFDTLGLFYYIGRRDSAKLETLRVAVAEWHVFLNEKFLKARANNYRRMQLIFMESDVRFFGEFDMDAHLPDMWYQARFNHLNGAAHYALTMSHFGIPFDLYEYPTYVRIEGGVDKKRFEFRITEKDAGYWYMGESARQKMVTRFTQDGLITKKENAELPADTLYNRIMFRNGTITLLELAGLEYMDVAKRLSNQGLYDSAYVFCCKAEILYPGNKVKYLKSNLVDHMVATYGKNQRNEHFTMLAALDVADLMDDEDMYDLCRSYLYDLIIRDGLVNKAAETWAAVAGSKMNATLKNRIKHIYFVFLTQYHSIQKDHCQAQMCACTAFALLPSSPLSKEAMDQSFLAGFRNRSCTAKGIKDIVETADSLVRTQMKSYHLVSALLGRVSARDKTVLAAMDMLSEYQLFRILYDRNMLTGTHEVEIAHLLEMYADAFYDRKDYKKCREILKLAKELGSTNRYWTVLESRLKGK
jgi:hypothetical protein